MSQRRSEHISNTRSKVAARPALARSAPPLPAPSSRNAAYFLGACALVLFVSLLVLAWANSQHDEPRTAAEDGLSVICQDFMRKHNAGDPTANQLLRDVPVVPDAVLTPAEAEQLETDLFLRDPRLKIIRVVDVKGEFVFVTIGNVSAPRLKVRQGNGDIGTPQRMMSNPDLYVGVRDGKIFGIRADLQQN